MKNRENCGKMTLLEKYQPFLVNNTQPGNQPVWLSLSAAGWKRLIRENLTPFIEEALHMRQIEDYLWATDYTDGRRKVLSFFMINDAYATFRWGWNFDFVPRIVSGGRLVWARTDKSIYTHIYEVSEDFSGYAVPNGKKQDISSQTGLSKFAAACRKKGFLNALCDGFSGQKKEQMYKTVSEKKPDARKMTIVSRYEIDAKNPEKGLAEKIEHHKAAFFYLLPLITEYYQATDTYEKILERIEQNMQCNYYRLINGDSSVISYLFIEKRLGMAEKAFRDFEKVSFRENVRDQLWDRLEIKM